MVKVKSSLGIITGKADNMRFYELNGEVIGVTIPAETNNPKTKKQMQRREADLQEIRRLLGWDKKN